MKRQPYWKALRSSYAHACPQSKRTSVAAELPSSLDHRRIQLPK
jgi:hypothetical protein